VKVIQQPQAHHATKAAQNVKSQNSICYTDLTRSRGAGCLKRRETMKHLLNKGAVVNIFQMSFNEGLLFEGKATIVKPVGDGSDEHYMVRFHADVGKYNGPTPTYERFIDRD
jgi:hypothetical protein